MTDAGEGYDAKATDGTLDVPLAPWRPARGTASYTAHGRRAMPDGTVALELQGTDRHDLHEARCDAGLLQAEVRRWFT